MIREASKMPARHSGGGSRCTPCAGERQVFLELSGEVTRKTATTPALPQSIDDMERAAPATARGPQERDRRARVGRCVSPSSARSTTRRSDRRALRDMAWAGPWEPSGSSPGTSERVRLPDLAPQLEPDLGRELLKRAGVRDLPDREGDLIRSPSHPPSEDLGPGAVIR